VRSVLGATLLCRLTLAGPAHAGGESLVPEPSALFVELRLPVDQPGSPAGRLPVSYGVGAVVPPLVVGWHSTALRLGVGVVIVGSGEGFVGSYQTFGGGVDVLVEPTIACTLHMFAGGRGSLYLEAAGGMDLVWGMPTGHAAIGARLLVVRGLSVGVESGLGVITGYDPDVNPVLETGVFGAATITVSFSLGSDR